MDTKHYLSVNNKDGKCAHLFYRQLCLSLIGVSFAFTVGLCLGTPTVAVPQLKRQANSTSAVSEEMASWITSVTPYAGAFWVAMATIFAYRFGRKKSMILTAISTFATSFLVYFSSNVLHLFISQSMYGLTHGAHTTICMMVVTEFTSPKYRGVFLALKAAAIYWGIWVANAIGIFSDYRYIGLVGVGCSIYNFIALVFMPESPYWLANHDRYHECAVAHRWLKGMDEESEKELDGILRSRKEQKECEKVKMNLFSIIFYYINALRKPEIFKPIILSLLLICMLHFSGKLVITVYAIEIMKKVTNSSSAAPIGVLILDGFTVVGTYAGCFLSKVLKRRTLLNGSAAVCAAFILILSFYLYLVELAVIFENHYISIILLVGYTLAASCGPLVLVTTLFAEMFPLENRSFTIMIICMEAKIVMGTLFKLGPLIFKTFGSHGTFLFFGTILSVCTTLSHLYVPETKDKTLQEISEYFRSKKSQAAEKSHTPLVSASS